MASANEQWDIVTGVGITALAVAAGRAMDTHRPDGLVRDPYAEAFVEAAKPPVAMPTRPSPGGEPLWEHLSDHMGVRSRYFDRFFEQAASAGIGQAVILASGLDARAFRLEWPQDFRLFEVDQPKVLDFKDQVLGERSARPACDRRGVRVDLRDDWAGALRDSGFDPRRPTAWLAEGLLPYLPPDAEQRLLEAVHELSAPGSRIALESPHRSLWQQDQEWFSEVSRRFGVDVGSLLHGDDRPTPDVPLTALGWRTSLEAMPEIAERYGRSLAPPAGDLAQRTRFVTARLPG